MTLPVAADRGTLTIDTITRISRQVAADYHSALDVVGVASTDGDGGRTELLVTIRGCHPEPCVVMLNVTRLGREAFERDLREQFGAALAAHVTQA
jgi:hypothetical protein